MTPPRITPTSVTVLAPDPHALAAFYARLLDTEVVDSDPDLAQVRTPTLTINLEREEHWQRPVWPAESGRPASTVHLDLRVEDLVAATAWATECGAALDDVQPQEDVRVMRDPAGHPFCLFL